MSLTRSRTFVHTFLNYEIWIILAFTGLAFLSTRFLPLAVLIGALFWGLRWYGNGYPSFRTPVDGAVLILLLMLPVTLWVTFDLDLTRIQVYRLLNGMVVYYSIVNWTNSSRRYRLLTFGLILLSVLLSIYAAISVEWYAEKIPIIPEFLYERFALLVGDTVHRNVMGGTLVLNLPVCASLLLFAFPQLSRKERGGLGLAGLLVLSVLVLTQSRGALLAFFAVVLFLAVLRWRWGWVTLPLIGIGGAIFLLNFGVENSLNLLSSGVSLDGLPGRLETWSRAMYMIRDFPFTGIGMGTFGPVAEKLYPFILAEPGSIPHAHNLFLQVAVDLGIPGFVAWMAILLTSTYTAWKIYRAGKKNGDLWLAGVGAGLLGSQFALALHGMLDAVTWGMVRSAPLVWVIWGLIFAYARVISQSDLWEAQK